MAQLDQGVRTIRSYNSADYRYRCIVTENSTSTSDNTSNVTITFSIAGPASWGDITAFENWNLYFGIIIDSSVVSSGSLVYPNCPKVGNSYVQLLTWTGNVGHKSDGSKSINVKVYLYHGPGNPDSYLPMQSDSNSPIYMGSVDLTTIPRASQPSCITYPNTTENIGDIGSTIYIHMNRVSSSFTHTVYYAWGTKYVQIAAGVTNNVSWKIPDDFLYDIPNATEGIGRIDVETYNGNSYIGAKSVGFTATVPSSVKPTVGTITLNPWDVNGYDILLQNKNKITVSVSGCSAGAGSSIKSYTFSGPGISSTTTGTSVSGGPISNAGTLTYTVTVTDNRGRSASKTATITCYAYSSPYFASFKAYRANADGSANVNGTYLLCTYSVNYASAGNTNTITVTVKGVDSNRTATGGRLLIDLSGNTTSTYQVSAVVSDKYGGQASSQTVMVFGETRVLNITKNGTGFAIGKMAESNELFECRWSAKFDSAASGPYGFSTSSDKRVKKNIQEIDVDIVDNLKPIQYELIQSSDNKIHYGFVAQDIEATLSNAGVNPDEIGIIGHIQNHGQQEYVLTYTEFIPLLTKKCQELQAETNMLKQEIAQLKITIESLQKD